MYVIRWHPSQCSVDPIEEIILDNDNHQYINILDITDDVMEKVLFEIV